MSYTDEQAEEWERKFKEADVDNDGKISLKELPKLMQACGMKSPNEFKMKLVLKTLDTDGDHLIDFEEFCQLTDPRLKVKLMREFKKYLTDGCYLKRDDVAEVLKSMSSVVTTQEIDDVLNEADKNGDGRLDHIEFIEYFMGKMQY